MAEYDLNAIADALAAVWQGMPTDTYDGRQQSVNAFAEVEGNVPVPAIVIELDDVNWDLTFDRGVDSFTFLAHLIVAEAGSEEGQRLVRKLLSSGGLAHSVKDRLEEDKTLGGLVSYAVTQRTRSVGRITYAGADYQGVTLAIEVVT
jgi:hypothetical protein